MALRGRSTAAMQRRVASVCVCARDRARAMARVGDNALRVRVDLSIASLLEVGEGRERRDGRERGDLGDGRAAGHASANLEGVGRHEEGGEGSDAVEHVVSKLL